VNEVILKSGGEKRTVSRSFTLEIQTRKVIKGEIVIHIIKFGVR